MKKINFLALPVVVAALLLGSCNKKEASMPANTDKNSNQALSASMATQSPAIKKVSKQTKVFTKLGTWQKEYDSPGKNIVCHGMGTCYTVVVPAMVDVTTTTYNQNLEIKSNDGLPFQLYPNDGQNQEINITHLLHVRDEQGIDRVSFN